MADIDIIVSVFSMKKKDYTTKQGCIVYGATVPWRSPSEVETILYSNLKGTDLYRMCDKNGMGFWVNGKERYFVIFMEGDVDLVICDENNFNDMYLAFVNDCREQGGTLYKQNPREEIEENPKPKMVATYEGYKPRNAEEERALANAAMADPEIRQVIVNTLNREIKHFNMNKVAWAKKHGYDDEEVKEIKKLRDFKPINEMDDQNTIYWIIERKYGAWTHNEHLISFSEAARQFFEFLVLENLNKMRVNPEGDEMGDDDKIDMSEVRENPGGTLFSKPEFKKYAKMIKITSVKDARDSIHKLNEEWKGATHAKKVRLIRVAVLAANRCAAMIKRKKRPLKAGTKAEKRKVEKIYRDWVKAHTVANPPEVDEVNDMEEEVKVEQAPKENPAEAPVVDESETEAEEVSEDTVGEDNAIEETTEVPVENPPESEAEVETEEVESDSEPKVEEETDEVVENPPSEEEAEPVRLVQKTLDVVENPPKEEEEEKPAPAPKHVLRFYGWSNPVDGKRIAIYRCKNCGKFFRLRAGEKE